MTPFVLIGYGKENGIPIFQRLFFRSSDELDISLLNLGAGKFIARKKALASYSKMVYDLEAAKVKSGLHAIFHQF